MKNVKSDVIARADVYVEGIGFIGVATYQSPELKFRKVTCDGGAGEYDVVWGAVEKLEASAKLTVTNDVLYESAMKLNDASFSFNEAIAQDGNVAKGRRDVLKGSVDVKENESKAGEKKEVELTISAHYWLKESGGKPMVEVDKLKDIVKVNDKDLLEEIRKAVGA